MSQDEKKQRAERFQNYIKAGNQNMTDDGAENYVKDIVSGEWHLFDSASKELTEETALWKRPLFSLKEWSMVYLLIIYGILICHMMNYPVPG